MDDSLLSSPRLNGWQAIKAVLRVATINDLHGFSAHDSKLHITDPDLVFAKAESTRRLDRFARDLPEHPSGQGMFYLPRRLNHKEEIHQMLMVLPLYDLLELVATSRGLIRDPSPFDR